MMELLQAINWAEVTVGVAAVIMIGAVSLTLVFQSGKVMKFLGNHLTSFSAAITRLAAANSDLADTVKQLERHCRNTLSKKEEK